MITWMVVWMRRHSADLKGDLQQRAELALVEGSAIGRVIMAFLAVLREGLETAVFLLAAFQQSDRPGLTGHPILVQRTCVNRRRRSPAADAGWVLSTARGS
jgi:FTR1 family protein